MVNPLKDFWEEYSYYIVLIILFLIFVVISCYLGFDDSFYNLYKINYSDINTSFISFFGVLFAFLFTLMAILFSLKEDSLFCKLIKDHKRNKKDVINYFSMGIFSAFVVTLISLFLLITFSPLTDNLASLNKILIHGLFYFSAFCLINVCLLLFVFINLIRD